MRIHVDLVAVQFSTSKSVSGPNVNGGADRVNGCDGVVLMDIILDSDGVMEVGVEATFDFATPGKVRHGRAWDRPR